MNDSIWGSFYGPDCPVGLRGLSVARLAQGDTSGQPGSDARVPHPLVQERTFNHYEI